MVMDCSRDTECDSKTSGIWPPSEKRVNLKRETVGGNNEMDI